MVPDSRLPANQLLLTVDSKPALGVVMIIALALGAAIRMVNYALYTAAIAAGVLVAMDLPHPSNLSAEGERVLYTFVGVGIGVPSSCLTRLSCPGSV